VSQPSPALFGALAAFVVGACAHGPKLGAAEEIRSTADSFHQRIRWRDFHGAAELLVPERRERFEHALRARGDERDLSISDYELEQERISADGTVATVVSRVSWTRLPSVVEHSELVTSELTLKYGVWLLSRQQGGPFGRELGEELPRNRPSAATR
jgi:hypothetical protein